jgi:hypothetical protein
MAQHSAQAQHTPAYLLIRGLARFTTLTAVVLAFLIIPPAIVAGVISLWP